MRDVYNRRKKLSDWIEKVNQDLDRSDRTDVLKFVEYMKYNANAILWIVRCITALISMRKFMRKSFRDANKEDIRALVDFIENHQNYLPLESEQSFSRKMTKGLGYEVRQYRENGERYYFYIGVRITDWRQKEVDEQSRLENLGEYSPITQEEMK
jgi:hypothetical protein